MASFGSFIFFILILLASLASKATHYQKLTQNFTDDPRLVDYVRSLITSFNNSYDSDYSSDTEHWDPMVPPPAVSPALYQNLASKPVLQQQMQKLYGRYEADWTQKNFEAMKAYVKEPYFSEQKQIFDSSFGSNFDVTYQPNILSATPLKVDLTPEGEYVKLQLNGEMINFEVSPEGTVMSGESSVRQFTEYWHVFIDLDKNIYLVGIDN